MAYSTISKPELYFNTVLYTGNATDNRTVTGVGFQPDWLWIKNRTDTEQHRLQDAVRGATKNIKSSGNGAEETTSNTVKSFDSDGFTLGVDNAINGNSDSMVSWNWKANGAGSANTDGSINSTVSVNTTAGFSIVKYTGNATNSTVGHGLGVTPQVVIVKNLISSGGSAEHWRVQHHKVAASKVLYLNLTNAEDTNGDFQSTYPGSSTFSISSADGCNKNGEANIAYCFAEKKGFSKFGNYTGNGNADGAFVYTGFKPAWLMIKRTNNTDNWYIKDNRRSGTAALQDFGQMNPNQTQHPSANNSNAENKASNFSLDILSNGFKCRGTDAGFNGSSDTYVYMAFAQEPLVANVGNSVPATAR